MRGNPGRPEESPCLEQAQLLLVLRLKCWWNDDALIPTRRARSGIVIGKRRSRRIWPMARSIALALLSWRMRRRSIPPNGAIGILRVEKERERSGER